MKKIAAVLCCTALLLLAAVSAWASDECYTLSGGDYFGGDMGLILIIQAPTDGGDIYTVFGLGNDSKGDTSALLHGVTQTSGHVKEFSLRGSGPIASDKEGGVWAMYEYHLTLGPSDSGWTGTYAGEVHTTDGAEKNVSGSVTPTSCTQSQDQSQ